jgi:hypothetical protein
LIAGSSLALAGAADAKPSKQKRSPFASSCIAVSKVPAMRTFRKGDAWRSSAPYKFPFYGETPRGMSDVLWKRIPGSTVRKASYPAPNLPSCRVGRFGTEDRATHKGGQNFAMLEPVDGATTYEFKDTFDRRLATLTWNETPPDARRPSQWGWFIDGKWAGHSATRAFEAQSNACKLVAQQTPTGVRWVRDFRYTMVLFNPLLGSPGKGYRPSGAKNLRIRAFIDRRAVPTEAQAESDEHDFGCGESVLKPRIAAQTLKDFQFHSGFGPGNSYLRGYYFGEGPTTVAALPGETRVRNTYPFDVYNPRHQFNHATYTMVNTTGVAGGGMVRGVVQSTVDNFTLYDEMRYCDPNFTLRNMHIRKGKKRYKKSLYFAPNAYSAKNRATVRWVYGRTEPNPATLTGEQQLAAQNPLSIGLFGWFPIYCDR